MITRVRKSPLLIVALIIASALLAPRLPYWFGWENGPVENTEAALLFAGGIIAVWFAAQAQTSQTRFFWVMIIPFWFVMGMRELSWGAVFLDPITNSAEMGPKFSSSIQLWYKPAITPIASLLALGCAAIFIKTKQYQTLITLWKKQAFPLMEVILAAIALVISGGSEGHMGMSYGWNHEWALQNLEEMTELCAYIALHAAQFRVHGAIG